MSFIVYTEEYKDGYFVEDANSYEIDKHNNLHLYETDIIAGSSFHKITFNEWMHFEPSYSKEQGK